MNFKPKNLKPLSILSVAEVAEKLKVNAWIIEAEIRKGELKGSKRFGEFFVTETDLVQYLKSGQPD